MNKNITVKELGESFIITVDLDGSDLQIKRLGDKVAIIHVVAGDEDILAGWKKPDTEALFEPFDTDWPKLTIDELETFAMNMSEYPKIEAYNWENLFHQHLGILLYTPGERSQKLLCEEWVVIMKDAINQFWSEQQPAGGLQDTDALFSEWAKKPRTPCGDN